MIALSVLAAPARAGDVLVFAAASTTDALNAVIAAWKPPAGTAVKVSYASSSALARQIENGAPVHLFLSANAQWMDYLAQRNRIEPASRRDLLRNALVLIAPANSMANIKLAPGAPLAEALGHGRLAIGDPDHVPAGIYAKQALTSLGLWDRLAPRTARAADVRAALVLVERREAPLGIVYATDARASAKVRIIDSFPRDSHPPVVYPAALVAGRGTAEARAFLAFMQSGEGRTIFGRYGFAVD